MVNTQIVSTLQNKSIQKKSIHHSSSTVFLAIYNPDYNIDTEVSLLNHFLLKRNLNDVIATIEIRNLDGLLINSFKENLYEEKAYSWRLSNFVDAKFIGAIYIYFKSNENLAVPFCAVTSSITSSKSICGVHTYGRRLEQKELGSNLDMKTTIETGWTARDDFNIKSFAVLHGGAFKLDLNIKLEITNNLYQIFSIEKEFTLEKYGTLFLVPQELSNNIVSHLKGEKGHIKVFIDGLRGIFPRMLCGNYFSENDEITNSSEIQFTHTNFDFSSISQPDAGGNYGYYNQPSIPNGYGIIYPVKTQKLILIDGETYNSNTMHKITIDKMKQLEVVSKSENLPSRFVAAAIGRWDNAKLESECSTGTFIEDYLKVPCHWHWGLLKPSLARGESVISIIVGKFNRNIDLNRNLNLRLYHEEGLLIEKDILVDGHKEINIMDMLPKKYPKSLIWYVLSGDNLEDLNIFSTFYPEDKAGFVEHAF